MRRPCGMKMSAQYTGRSVYLRQELISLRGGMMDRQKSADDIVAAVHGNVGRNM